MKKLLISILTPLVFGNLAFGNPIGYNLKDRMPPLPEENIETSWFSLWKNGVVIFLDLNKDEDYDLAASYIKCGEHDLRIKIPYGIFDRKGIYGKPGILYLDNDMDSYINEILENIGDRDVRKDAPDCPKE